MAKKETRTPKTSETSPGAGWHIEPEWFLHNNRSLETLVKSHLCPKCAKKLTAKGNLPTLEEAMAAIESCCSRGPDFISDRLSVMESIFRLLLSNGNRPMETEELSRQLNERRGGDPYRTAQETLLRLLGNDRYYGIREIKAE